MNIYEMYHANDNCFGFWVRRATWGNTVAKVISIEGVSEGDNLYNMPYCGNKTVLAVFHEADSKENAHVGNVVGVEELLSPGTFQYEFA